VPDIQLATRTDAIALIRNEPVQARSTARLAALLDAAAQVVHEIGYERLTTAMVAERAGASIGTVYRYFPDRIAVLQSLAARNAERMTDRVLAELRDERHTTWDDALSAGFGLFVVAFADEPGFASLRYGDVLDLRPTTEVPAYSVLSEQMFDALAGRFGLTDTTAARAAFQASVIAFDAIAAHAFVLDPKGSQAYLDLGSRATRALLAEYFG
jgi:AcrR family transcriptional regulator